MKCTHFSTSKKPLREIFNFILGNWWGRRLFGTVDVLNVEFHFDKREYEKLSKAFELEYENKRLNSDAIERLSKENERLQSLIDSQDERDQQKEKLRAQIKAVSQEKSNAMGKFKAT